MIRDLDTYRAANLLIKQHGDEAEIHAAMRVDEQLNKGDMDGPGGVVEGAQSS